MPLLPQLLISSELQRRRAVAHGIRFSAERSEHIARPKWKRHDARVSGLSNILINTSVPAKRRRKAAKRKNGPSVSLILLVLYGTRTDVGWY